MSHQNNADDFTEIYVMKKANKQSITDLNSFGWNSMGKNTTK